MTDQVCVLPFIPPLTQNESPRKGNLADTQEKALHVMASAPVNLVPCAGIEAKTTGEYLRHFSEIGSDAEYVE